MSWGTVWRWVNFSASFGFDRKVKNETDSNDRVTSYEDEPSLTPSERMTLEAAGRCYTYIWAFEVLEWSIYRACHAHCGLDSSVVVCGMHSRF